MRRNQFNLRLQTSPSTVSSPETSGLLSPARLSGSSSFATSGRLSSTTASSSAMSADVPILPASPVSPMQTRERIDNFAYRPEPVDYFNFKKQSYFSSSPLTPSKSLAGFHPKFRFASHFSPSITPATLDLLNRSTPPVVGLQSIDTDIAITPDEGPFPYIEYESTHVPSLPIKLASSFDHSTPVIKTMDIKVYFQCTDDLVKFRVNSETSLADFIRLAAARIPSGWESIHALREGVQMTNVLDEDRSNLVRLGRDSDWKSWISRPTVGGRSHRLILWAL